MRVRRLPMYEIQDIVRRLSAVGEYKLAFGEVKALAFRSSSEGMRAKELVASPIVGKNPRPRELRPGHLRPPVTRELGLTGLEPSSSTLPPPEVTPGVVAVDAVASPAPAPRRASKPRKRQVEANRTPPPDPRQCVFPWLL